MKRRIFSFLCGVLLFSGMARAQDGKDAKDAVGRAEALRVVDLWLDSVHAYQHIPAISAGVVVGDDLVWAKGFGTIDAGHTVAATPQTIYSICSISKLFTSISLMQLEEAGKVRLDDPITTYLPWATIQPAADSGPITLRGLLTHSAGIPREAEFPYWTGPDFTFPTHEEIRAKIATQTALYPAERYFQYSNLGLTLVGETVAAVSGETYTHYAQTHVLDPIGLKDTRMFLPMDLYGKQLAVGYGALKRDGTRDLVKPFNTKGILPAAGYTSTVEDLGRFASWQFRLLRTGKTDVLEAPTLREMQRVQFMDPDWKTTRGLGFSIQRIDDHTLVGHAGDCPGYQTVLAMRNEDQTAVIVLDDSAEQPGTWAKAVFAILDKRKGYAFKAPMPATNVSLEDYTGLYSEQPWEAETAIFPWAGGLVIFSLPTDDPAGEMEFLKPKGGDLFRRVRKDGTEAEEVKFVRDAAGKVTSYVNFSNPSYKESSPIAVAISVKE
ncbi:MAG: serine hydrolase domain-containing protein [Terracidiphilus sp.]|jgi:CubicO group peptidase (beta-lactamase class C family)